MNESGADVRWRIPLTWPVLLGVAWLVYEFTARPALGVLVLSLKFGWEDFLTAYWLRRIDPDAGRGKTCFLAYTAHGLFRAGLVACFLTGILEISMFPRELQRPGKPLPNEVVTPIVVALVTTGSTLLLAGLVGGLTLFYAMRYQVKVWVHSSSLRRARQTSDWSAVLRVPRRKNVAQAIFTIGLFLVGFPIGFSIWPLTGYFVACIFEIEQGLAMFLSIFPLLFIVPLACWPLLRRVIDGVKNATARSPEECWAQRAASSASITNAAWRW
jgi:hypothetical protein